MKYGVLALALSVAVSVGAQQIRTAKDGVYTAAQATRGERPVYLPNTNLRLEKLQAVFAIALHMQQPLIPAGGPDLRSADIIAACDEYGMAMVYTGVRLFHH